MFTILTSNINFQHCTRMNIQSVQTFQTNSILAPRGTNKRPFKATTDVQITDVSYLLPQVVWILTKCVLEPIAINFEYANCLPSECVSLTGGIRLLSYISELELSKHLSQTS